MLRLRRFLAIAALVFVSLGSAQVGSATIHVRQEVHSLTPDQVVSLRNGVAEMRRRSEVNPNDPTGWAFQTRLHLEGPCGYHATWLFLPWHRIYLYHFERILRAASGDPNLTLPYWDYTNPSNLALPEIFRTTGDNPLFNPNRTNLNDGSAMPSSTAREQDAMSASTFSTLMPGLAALSFAGVETDSCQAIFEGRRVFGAAEFSPHNLVHGFIGGDMGTFNSPNDPIFWVHHATIDRMWERWLSSNPDLGPSDPHWWLQSRGYTFYDESGEAIHYSYGDLSSLVTRDLGYVYDILPEEARLVGTPIVDAIPDDSIDPVAVVQGFVIRPNWRENLIPFDGTALLAPAPDADVRLILRLQASFATSPSVVFELYLGDRADAEEGQRDWFQYLGAFGVAELFAHSDGEHAHSGDTGRLSQSFAFDVTEPFQSITEHGAPDLVVVVIPRGPNDVVFGPEPDFSVPSFEMLYGAILAADIQIDVSIERWLLPR